MRRPEVLRGERLALGLVGLLAAAPVLAATAAGGEIKVTLGPFDVLNLETDDATFQDDIKTMADLSGTIVTASEPVAVFSGVETTSAPGGVLEVPTYPTAVYGEAPLVDAVATRDPETGAAAVFVVNRSLDEAITVSIDVERLGALRVAETHTLSDEDPFAANTLEDRERVSPAANDSARLEEGVLTIELPPVSWTAISLIR